MEEILERCCGLDVHRDSITACIMIGNGTQKRKQIKTFSTFTRNIRELADWLQSEGIKHVVMESTGIYWKPIFHIFDELFDICLVNPQHAKNVPGRKTDVKDSEWLCRLLKCGLLSKSFIPPKAIVRLRELVRYRQSLVRDLSSAKNRIIKALENANVKLSSVFSNVFGVTAWDIIIKLIEGETNLDTLTFNIPRSVKSSREEIKMALEGTLENDDRKLLQEMKDHVEYLEKKITGIDGIIEKHIEPYRSEVDLLKTLPGVKDFAAAAIISEIGVDMDQFRDAPHLTAWGGMCPGSNQSAGKIKSSRIRRGNTYLKVILTQVAWAIAKTKKTYLGTKYRALSCRRGKKRAIIAIGRKALVICYHLLKKKVPFHELGVNFLDNLEPERKAKYHTKRLEELGYEIKITKKVA